MRKTLETYVASRIQMVQIRKRNGYFVTDLLFVFVEQVLWGISALRAPTVGPYVQTNDIWRTETSEQTPQQPVQAQSIKHEFFLRRPVVVAVTGLIFLYLSCPLGRGGH